MCAANSKCEDDWATCTGKCIPLSTSTDDSTKPVKPIKLTTVPPAGTTSKPSAGGASCPPGVATVNCLVDPCKSKTCGENEVCESNYCGGCNAVCKPKPTAGKRVAGVKGCSSELLCIACSLPERSLGVNLANAAMHKP